MLYYDANCRIPTRLTHLYSTTRIEEKIIIGINNRPRPITKVSFVTHSMNNWVWARRTEHAAVLSSTYHRLGCKSRKGRQEQRSTKKKEHPPSNIDAGHFLRTTHSLQNAGVAGSYSAMILPAPPPVNVRAPLKRGKGRHVCTALLSNPKAWWCMVVHGGGGR